MPSKVHARKGLAPAPAAFGNHEAQGGREHNSCSAAGTGPAPAPAGPSTVNSLQLKSYFSKGLSVSYSPPLLWPWLRDCALPGAPAGVTPRAVLRISPAPGSLLRQPPALQGGPGPGPCSLTSASASCPLHPPALPVGAAEKSPSVLWEALSAPFAPCARVPAPRQPHLSASRARSRKHVLV